MEYRARGRGELIAASLALNEATGRNLDCDHLLLLRAETLALSLVCGELAKLFALDAALHAGDVSVRPAHRGEIIQAGILAGELSGYVYQVHGVLRSVPFTEQAY